MPGGEPRHARRLPLHLLPKGCGHHHALAKFPVAPGGQRRIMDHAACARSAFGIAQHRDAAFAQLFRQVAVGIRAQRWLARKCRRHVAVFVYVERARNEQQCGARCLRRGPHRRRLHAVHQPCNGLLRHPVMLAWSHAEAGRGRGRVGSPRARSQAQGWGSLRSSLETPSAPAGGRLQQVVAVPHRVPARCRGKLSGRGEMREGA